MVGKIEFDRHKAAVAIFGNITLPTVDGPYVDSRLNTLISSIQFSVRTSNCLKNEKIELLGDLIQKGEADFLRVPGFGRKGLNEIKAYLAGEGLALANWEVKYRTKPALKESSTDAPKPLDSPPQTAVETHDEFSTIADQLLPAGAVGYIASSQKADALVKAAKEIFVASEGRHRDGDGIAADYSFAIKRLPPQESNNRKTYPVYLSDTALEVLSKPDQLKQFHKALKVQMTQSSAIG